MKKVLRPLSTVENFVLNGKERNIDAREEIGKTFSIVMQDFHS